MERDAYGVRIGTTEVDYEDGAEAAVLSDLERIVDRSDGSDELTMLIRDWPTSYHFSPSRSNLLRPIRIDSRDRVLEVGCGSGPITRWLGERGADVLAIDGNVEHADRGGRALPWDVERARDGGHGGRCR